MKMTEFTLRESGTSDLDDVLDVERRAFGYEKEARLVKELLSDETAAPSRSILAFANGKAVGHILFTAARLDTDGTSPRVSLLAPLAVVPEYQKKGVGKMLMAEGLRLLKRDGVALVFVLGHPDYYPQGGFSPAGVKGFEAPYPIPDKYADAWMVQELQPGTMGNVTGKVICADALNLPEHWRE